MVPLPSCFSFQVGAIFSHPRPRMQLAISFDTWPLRFETSIPRNVNTSENVVVSRWDRSGAR